MKPLYKIGISAMLMLFAATGIAQLAAPINFSLPPNKGITNVRAAEFYFDKDPGLGNGITISLTAGREATISNFSIPKMDTLSKGVHRLYVRTQNIDGNWSMSNAATFFIIPKSVFLPANNTTTDVTAAEYFIDNDPGLGNGTVITIGTGTAVSASNIAIPINTLSTGVHRIYVRTKNTKGNWSITNVSNFYIVNVASYFPANAAVANVTAAEYFLDADPGLGKGASIPISAGIDVSGNNMAIPIASLATGVHRIYVRTQNTLKTWSLTNVASFYIVPVSFVLPPNKAVGNITALEYFFDTDPGYGNGTMIPISPTTDLSNYNITADISGLKMDTTHTLYVRTLDGWSEITAASFAMGTPLPVKWASFTAKLQADNSVLLRWQTVTEQNSKSFAIERSSDGVGFISMGEIDAAGNSTTPHNYMFVDQQPLPGNNYYRIEQVDVDGHATYSSIIPIHIVTHSANDFYIINNPAHSELRVHIGDKDMNDQLSIFDMSGRSVMRVPVTTNDIQQINVSTLPTGLYIIQRNSKGNTISKKFLKE